MLKIGVFSIGFGLLVLGLFLWGTLVLVDIVSYPHLSSGFGFWVIGTVIVIALLAPEILGD